MTNRTATPRRIRNFAKDKPTINNGDDVVLQKLFFVDIPQVSVELKNLYIPRI
jgi:hypothetical protein